MNLQNNNKVSDSAGRGPCGKPEKTIKKTPLTGRRVGLALGGGSARGWAHIGVLRELQERNISIHCLAGTSIGAFVGAFWAAGVLDILEEKAENLNKWKAFRFFDLTWKGDGFFGGRRIIRFMKKHIGDIKIEDLPIPFAAASIDLNTGEKVVFRNGDLIQAVRASISLPGIFSPVKTGGQLLVDGCLADPLPVELVRELGAEKVIAVDLNSHNAINDRSGEAALGNKSWFHRKKRPGLRKIAYYSLLLMIQQITEARLSLVPCDVLIQPPLADFSGVDFHRAEDAIRIGREATAAALEQM